MHHSDKDIEFIEKHKDELDVPGVLWDERRPTSKGEERTKRLSGR